MGRRVVVTGIGLVTSVGVGCDEVWGALLAGRSGIGPVESFDTSAYRVHVGGEIRDFDGADYVRNLEPASMGRAAQLAVAAARLAVEDAGIDPELEPQRAGVAMGTTSGEPREVERFDDSFLAGAFDRIGPEFIAQYPSHVIPELVAAELGLEGVNIMIPAACAAGNYALSFAFDALSMGRADVMLAGGADCFSRITYTGFARLGAIAEERCQPFDRNRKGMIPGEGAGVLVLEPLQRALARGARVYAEISGYGLTCDAHHMTGQHPEGRGAARAMEIALEHSGLAADEVDYISAHGTGTPTNDRVECLAVKRVLGESAYGTPISSVKSMLGHTMGAASAIEAAVCAQAIASQRVPPTIHLEEPDPECDLDCVANVAREHRVGVAMNNAYAFGGNNACVIFRECRP